VAAPASLTEQAPRRLRRDHRPALPDTDQFPYSIESMIACNTLRAFYPGTAPSLTRVKLANALGFGWSRWFYRLAWFTPGPTT
jgi:hypothetical protein